MKKEWYLDTIVYKFTQEGNTNGTTNEDEILTITVESVIESIEKEGGFLVLRTEGWSVNNIKELQEMLNFIEQGIGSEKKE